MSSENVLNVSSVYIGDESAWTSVKEEAPDSMEPQDIQAIQAAVQDQITPGEQQTETGQGSQTDVSDTSIGQKQESFCDKGVQCDIGPESSIEFKDFVKFKPNVQTILVCILIALLSYTLYELKTNLSNLQSMYESNAINRIEINSCLELVEQKRKENEELLKIKDQMNDRAEAAEDSKIWCNIAGAASTVVAAAGWLAPIL